MHTLGFGFREFKTVVCCPFIYFVEVQLYLSFYYVHMGSSVADDKSST